MRERCGQQREREREIYISSCVGTHPEVDRIWTIQGIHEVSIKDHILSTPVWLCTRTVSKSTGGVESS